MLIHVHSKCSRSRETVSKDTWHLKGQFGRRQTTDGQYGSIDGILGNGAEQHKS